MNKVMKTVAAAAITGCLCAQADMKAVEVDYRVVPLPQEVSVSPGGFALGKDVRIVYPEGNEAMKRNAGYLAGYLREATGTSYRTEAGGGRKGDIILRLESGDGLPEAYTLKVDGDGIVISGTGEAGVFYGIQTLRKSIPAVAGASLVLPAVEVKDAPRFGYRGAHFDVSRHFFTVDEAKTFIDMMALHNMNRLHWHITDDQGWRIEIKKYPRLTEIGSKRKETVIGRNSGKYDGKPYGGHFTQEQAREIVDYAAKRYITVIPEIDLPGHMQAALAAYPELGCTGGPYDVWTMWGVSEDVLCAGNDKVLDFIDDVLTEIMDIFPSEYIHIGGDEASKGAWRTCPKCKARMEREGLKDVDELQSYLIRRIERHINARGRKLLGWDEILEGGLAPNATVMSWRGVEGGIAAARSGHHAVMSPGDHCYLDFCQDDPTVEPPAAAAFLTLPTVYEYDPAPDSLGEAVVPMILGVQGNLWCERVPTEEHCEHMLWPRGVAIAEVGWTQPEHKDYDDFYARVLVEIERMQERGYHPFEQKDAVGSRVESREPVACLSTGKAVTYNTAYSPKYAAAGDGTLTDGLRGGWNYGDKRWQGWIDSDVDVVVDLERKQPLTYVGVDFMQGFSADIWMPREVEISVSDDGERYTTLAVVANDIPFEYRKSVYETFAWSGEAEGRYVRIVARHNGHKGGWIFCDEVVVR